MMTTSPPPSSKPSSASASERPAFVLGGLLLPLLDAGYEDDAREVVQLYIEDHHSKMEEIDRALDEGDLETCGQASHLLIGSAGGIGASELAAALTALEEACRSGEPLEVRDRLELVRAEEGRVLDSAQRFVEGGTT